MYGLERVADALPFPRWLAPAVSDPLDKKPPVPREGTGGSYLE